MWLLWSRCGQPCHSALYLSLLKRPNNMRAGFKAGQQLHGLINLLFCVAWQCRSKPAARTCKTESRLIGCYDTIKTHAVHIAYFRTVFYIWVYLESVKHVGYRHQWVLRKKILSSSQLSFKPHIYTFFQYHWFGPLLFMETSDPFTAHQSNLKFNTTHV